MLTDFPKKSCLTTVMPLPPTIAAGCRKPNAGSPAWEFNQVRALLPRRKAKTSDRTKP